ncbi:MAG TPA: type IX secretion system membrane protein PorP/SprF [Lacibacter sp.]|nr:type IX secretion system membrane protein PorP/SprF [Lacibacter sp.]HMO90535.1 type IX secretion system membrane protein PorP/SprF [Lacibacter sp.]
MKPALLHSLRLFIALLLVQVAAAQNPRLALYDASPLHVNPAFAGKFNGKYRVGAHVSSMSADSAKMLHNNVMLDFRSKYEEGRRYPENYFGLGLNYYRYGSNTSELSASFISLSGAYHTYIDRRKRHAVDIGVQGAFASGKLDRTPFRSGDGRRSYFDPEISGGGFAYRAGDSDTPQVSHSYIDFSVGVNYAFRSNQFRFESGLAMYHLFYPANDIFQLDPDIPRLRHRGVFTMNFGFDLDEEHELMFRSMYWADGLFWLSRSFNDRGTDEYKVSAWAGLELNKLNPGEKNLTVNYALFTRSFRTVMPVVGVTYKKNYHLRATYEQPMNSKNFSAYTAKRLEAALIITLNPKGRLTPYTED